MTRLQTAHRFSRNRFTQFRQAVAGMTAVVILGWSSTPVLGADPFRTQNPHDIGDDTEAAFVAIFQEGNYPKARQLLQTAVNTDEDEPMVHGMLASMAYLDQDWEEMQRRADLTFEKAQAMIAADPLRGNLYSAVGIFLQGAYILKTQGTVRGTPVALTMLQQVFSYLDEAEKVNPNDPELSLIKGYMDLFLAVNLPFANPQQAIDRLDTYAAPVYLSQRGIALGYRDLRELDDATVAVDKALAAAPNNPELLYLKAQITAMKGNRNESLALFNEVLNTYTEQLPNTLVRQIQFEQCVLADELPDNECGARYASSTTF